MLGGNADFGCFTCNYLVILFESLLKLSREKNSVQGLAGYTGILIDCSMIGGGKIVSQDSLYSFP